MCRHYEPSPVPGADPAGEHTSSCNAVCRRPSCQIGLPAPSGSGNKEIPVFCDVFTGCKPLNQRAVQLTPGSIVNIANVCVRLVKSGIMDQTFQAVALAVVVFDIHQHPETILKSRYCWWDAGICSVTVLYCPLRP